MPLLVYCITEKAAVAPVQHPGVNDCPVESIEQDGLQCFVSQSASEVQPSNGSIRDAALVFHRVLEKIFEQTAIIPFRFPTILKGESDVIAHLKEHSEEYRAALIRLRDMVQMEMKLQFKISQSPQRLWKSPTRPGIEAKPSGTEYLRKIRARHEKLEAVAKELRRTSDEMIKGWRQSDSSEGIRCFILIKRGSVNEFQSEAQAIKVDSDIEARLSGPWPASHFLKED